MLSRKDYTELIGWSENRLDAINEAYSTGDITIEECRELREQAIATLKKLNYMVNYIESRIVQLKGDLAEAKVFDTCIKEAMLSARLNELEALMEARPVDTLV